MLHGHLVAVHDLALEVAVDFMEVESVATRDEALGLEDISTEFVDITRCSRVITCRLNTSREVSCLDFETLYVVGLPAVHAEVEVLKLLEHLFCVDSEFCVTLFRDFVSLMNKCFFHSAINLLVIDYSSILWM